MRPVSLILSLAVLIVIPTAALSEPEPCEPAKSCPQIPYCSEEEEEAHSCERSGLLSFQSTQGFVQKLVEVRQWQIGNLATARIHHDGFLVVQLRAGTLFAQIGHDEPREWKVGSFLSVPAGQELIVHTQNDSVVLQTVNFPIQ